ncbi:MAG: hypothetical protein AAFR66_19805 [Bacteroidota bacterium]
MSMRLPMNSKRDKLVETFFVEEGITQYFIKPLMLKGEKKSTLYVDFTFRDQEVSNDSATVNFSIEDENTLKKIESLTLITSDQTVSVSDISFLLTKDRGGSFESRYSSRIPLEEVKKLFEKEEWKATVLNEGSTMRFSSSGKAERSIEKLNERIFSQLVN